jgi:hypothetical protein
MVNWAEHNDNLDRCLVDIFNQDSSVERAQVGYWWRIWVGACDAEGLFTRRQWLHRVRSTPTQAVNCIKEKNVNFHKDLMKITSSQLRKLDLREITFITRNNPSKAMKVGAIRHLSVMTNKAIPTCFKRSKNTLAWRMNNEE